MHKMTDSNNSAVLDSLARIRQEINRSTESIEKLQKQEIESTIKTIKAINDLLKSQQETEIAKIVASMSSKNEQVNYEEKAIDYEKIDLNNKIDKIIEHYIEIQNNLDKELDERIHRIGNHIFEIIDNEGTNTINRFDTAKLEASNAISNKVKQIYDTKIKLVENAFHNSVTNIIQFREARQKLIENIHHILIEKAMKKPVQFHIPFWIVQVENTKTKETTTLLIGPSHVSGTEKVSILPKMEFKSLIDSLSNKVTEILQNIQEEQNDTMKQKYIEGTKVIQIKNVINDEIINRSLNEDAITYIKELKIIGGKNQ